MAVLKVIELLSESEKGWDDAAAKGIAEANQTLKNIRSAYVQNQTVTVKGGKIDKYRVNLKVTFEIEK